MTGKIFPQATIAILAAILVGFFGWPTTVPVYAQVTLEVGNGELVVRNEGFRAQRAFRAANKNGGNGGAQWFVEDEVGNSYEACSSTCYAKEDGSWSCSGYSADDGVAPQLVEGYAVALQHLVDHHGALVEHDPFMDVDHVSFPDSEDPYQTLVDALLNDVLDGRLLVEYFKALEISTKGPDYSTGIPAKPKGKKHTNPDDPFFGAQWNLDSTRLFEAMHSPFQSNLDRPVRIGIVDSGIDGRFDQHVGLDGVSQVVHRWTAQTTGFATPHALGIATLLADAANDGDGIAGLLGKWDGGCAGGNAAAFELYSYNVGDFGPVSYLVARAVTAAVADDVDVINLSLRIAYSPMVEEAIRTALANDVVVVAAAGNYHAGAKVKPTGFPANMDGVIAVSGMGRSLRLNQYSANKGFDLVAPGEDVIFGGQNDSWLTGDGTSYAAPHVTAAAALLKAVNPDLTSWDVLDVLQSTGRSTGMGGGVFVDALAALESLGPDTRVQTAGCGLNKGIAAGPGGEQVHSAPHLIGNYPNPFNPATIVTFSVSVGDDVQLQVYDAMGRRVSTLVNGPVSAGIHDVRFDATHLPSGIYYYQLTTSTSREHGVMTLVR